MQVVKWRKEVRTLFDVIVWATDGSEAADSALPHVKALAGRDGAKLIVVHVNERGIGRSAGYPADPGEEQLKAHVEQRVQELQAAGIESDVRVASIPVGGVAHLLADVAKDAGADLIVVGTRGQGMLTGILLGSVTQRLLHIAPCAVLAVPPAGR